MSILHIDWETFCAIPINHGTHAYAEKAELMVLAYAFDDLPVEVIDLTSMSQAYYAGCLRQVQQWIDDAEVVVVHNSHFDRTVMRWNGVKLPTEKIHDTMIRAFAHGLPGSLDKLSDIFKLGDKAKSKEGKALIQLFCKYRPKRQKIRRATRETHPEEWQKFLDYAKSDIEAMRVLYHRLPMWNYRDAEVRLWELDQRVNDRGVCVDIQLAMSALKTVEAAQIKLGAKTSEITYGHVESATKRQQLLDFIHAYWPEIYLPDMKMDTIEKLLDGELPDDLRELLVTRLQTSTTSTRKYHRVLTGVSTDGRLRGLVQFGGAPRTMRDSGRLFQPQNLMRPTLKNTAIEEGVAAMKAGMADLMYDNVMEIAANAMRGVIVASPGKKLVVSDLSNIEGRAGAWLGDEEWKLEAFRLFDAGKGKDLYRLSYGRMFNIDPDDVDELMRQIGKVCELMLQYEGGVGAWITGAMTYGIDLQAMAEGALRILPGWALKEARKAYQWANKKGRTFGLAEDVFVVCDAFKRMWREAHPGIVAVWGELDEAVRQVIEHPRAQVQVRSLLVCKEKNWLKIVLPSGRALSYPSPRIERGKISYMGLTTFSRKWTRLNSYGGKLFENVTQAFARDVFKGTDMREGIDDGLHITTSELIEQAGYHLLIPVHDENITETEDTDEFSAEGLSELMVTPLGWAPGLPLAAKGFETYRYRKG